ncbi:MAG: IclR family transcriptional regulator [Firmicutes bacterium]|nr:IclR family transcriptional regulator [Bacillota bacterium]
MAKKIMENGSNRNKSVQVLERCFLILEAIAANQGEASLSALSKSLFIPHSTIHRILSCLIKLGYVEQNQQNGHYRLGLKILSLSNVILGKLDLRKVAREYLEELVQETGESANLLVLHGNEVVYIDKVDGPLTVRVISFIGKRASVHTTGGGKVLLSEMALPDIIEILKHKGMPRLTQYSITDVPTFLDELNKVRKQGFALDNEESEIGAKCIAAPVRDHKGRIIASLSISGPSSRLTPANMQNLISIVKRVAFKLSTALGYSKEERLG